jgi:hypothetical protein
MAVLDALAYQEGEKNEGGEDTFAERLDQLAAKVDALTMSPTEETQEPEDEEAASPYDPEVIAYFSKLNDKDKHFLSWALLTTGVIRQYHIKNMKQKATLAKVYKIAPTRQSWPELHKYLVQEKILPK